jgi:hypothetical protein
VIEYDTSPGVVYEIDTLYFADWRPAPAPTVQEAVTSSGQTPHSTRIVGQGAVNDAVGQGLSLGRSNQEFEATRRGLRMMREMVVQAAGSGPNEAVWRTSEGGGPRLLFLSRSKDQKRHDKRSPRSLLNEEEVLQQLVAILGQENVAEFHGGAASLVETVEAFSSADIVVAVFGGTMANIAFCRPVSVD